MAASSGKWDDIGPVGGGSASYLGVVPPGYTPQFEDYYVSINGEWRSRSDPNVEAFLNDLCGEVNYLNTGTRTYGDESGNTYYWVTVNDFYYQKNRTIRNFIHH